MSAYPTRAAASLLGLLVGSMVAMSQAPDPSRWGSVYVAGGTYFVAGQPLFRGDLEKLAPGSVLLAQDLSDHNFSNDRYYSGTGSFEISLGFLPWQREGKPGPELRLGVIYAGSIPQNALLQRTTRTPYDTLTSSQTGEQFFVDSMHQSSYWIEHSAERFGLNASLIWRTQARWSFFGGCGLAGGPAMNAGTYVRHTLVDRIDGPGANYEGGQYSQGYSAYTNGTEFFRNGTGWWLSMYTPIGLDFQIARYNAFWNRLHLYYEVRPQLLVQNSPELGTYTDFGIQSLFGARLKI
ncbi:MAG TPA: hypothetical protein PLB89_08030 [Flavobacteriales bacterium]|nr:hypothetical protein [Flavobacteriales bacterium]